MSDTQDLIGKVLDAKAQRDAIHIAVAPVVAGQLLGRGDHIALKDGKAVHGKGGLPAIGIVDPFLRGTVEPGQRFFMFLYPNTITSLRHQWRHEAFDGAIAESEKWLRDFASFNCSDDDNESTPEQCYERLLKMAEEGNFCFSSQPDELYDSSGQMKIWHHIEVVRGEAFSHGHKENAYFSCSC